MVKGCSQVLDDISSASQRIERVDGEFTKFTAYHVSVLILAFTYYPETSFLESGQFCCEIAQMLFGPFNFNLDENQPTLCLK